MLLLAGRTVGELVPLMVAHAQLEPSGFAAAAVPARLHTLMLAAAVASGGGGAASQARGGAAMQLKCAACAHDFDEGRCC